MQGLQCHRIRRVSLKFDVGRSLVACTPDTVPLAWRCRRANERVLLYTGAPGFSERRERSLQHFVVHRGDMQSLPLCRVAHPRYANCRVLKRSTLRGRRVRSPLRGLSLSSNRGRDRGRITGCSRGLQARDYIVVTGPTFSDTCH